MNCINPKCNEQATPVVKFGIVISYICEHCYRKFGVSDNGQATSKEIEDLQHEEFEQTVETGSYSPIRRYFVELKQKGNIKILDPVHEREKTFTKHCHLRGRG